MSDEAVFAVPTAAEVRAELLELVRADLYGPQGGAEEEFRTSESPLARYPLGRLAPCGELIEPAEQETLGSAGADTDTDDGAPEPSAPSQPSLAPSALGFTATVAGDVDRLIVSVTWGRYVRTTSHRDDNLGESVWRRVPCAGEVPVELVDGQLAPLALRPDEPNIVVRGRARRYQGNWLVTLFIENRQHQSGRGRDEAKWIFQVELSATGPDGAAPFLARAERPGGGDEHDRSEQLQLAMAYRRHREYAVGSGTAVHATVDPLTGRASTITTTAIGEYEIPHTDVPSARNDQDLPELADVELRMAAIADLAEQGSPLPLLDALNPLVTGYREWIRRERQRIDDPSSGLAGYAADARHALVRARVAADRIAAGIDLLRANPLARAAFGFANRAMHLQRVHTKVAEARRRDSGLGLVEAEQIEADLPPEAQPAWRPFQLAFVLLNLPSLADPTHQERSEDPGKAIADLLWFPTGGGKTEAYLGLTAFTIAIRRLHGSLGGLNAAAGVAVLMRYTLRLLTIQQFERAATLICAAETLRRADPATWGRVPIRIGMWVGNRVTPNTSEQSQEWIKEVRRQRRAPAGIGSPHQLSSCPWCGTEIEAGKDIHFNRDYRRTLIVCPDLTTCPFGALAAGMLSTSDAGLAGLPVLVVDDEIYRHPPALLIATVDKFAQLPWNGQTAILFGRPTRYCGDCGYLTEDSPHQARSHQARNGAAPAFVVDEPEQLRPPDLIIQDELHLISGPLGSLVGLYETAVDRLASWEHSETGRLIRPKVVASTATVRRARPQIRALFYRSTEVFPPPGLDVEDSFFARQRDRDTHPGRKYVGICAHGTRIRSTLIRLYVSILGAAQTLHEKYGRNEVTDPYMTLVGYFNSLRDLGAMRRMVEDDVSARLNSVARWRRGEVNRRVRQRELTSRLSSEQIRPLLDELGVPFPARRDEKSGKSTRPLDVLLATNMIAVGVDVPRLGAMVVTNQPKSTAEYIQATSRVGRVWPGIVFTVYNWARPRDLSAYEHFEYLHANVYRQVEALSVTPFADRAIDRGLFGVLVGLVRDLERTYNGNRSAQLFDRHSKLADHVIMHLRRRAGVGDRTAMASSGSTWQRVDRELDTRLAIWDQQRRIEGQVVAYRGVQDAVSLMLSPDDRTVSGSWNPRICLKSLRDVEPAINLLMRPPAPLDGTQPSAEPPWLPYPPPDALDAEADEDGDDVGERS